MNRRHRKLKAALAEAIELVQSLHLREATFVGLVGRGEYDSKVKAAQVAALAYSHAICEHEMLYGKPASGAHCVDQVAECSVLGRAESKRLTEAIVKDIETPFPLNTTKYRFGFRFS